MSNFSPKIIGNIPKFSIWVISLFYHVWWVAWWHWWIHRSIFN